jgi:sulfur transfer complex TusBCD TusB component (DsrH family)
MANKPNQSSKNSSPTKEDFNNLIKTLNGATDKISEAVSIVGKGISRFAVKPTAAIGKTILKDANIDISDLVGGALSVINPVLGSFVSKAIDANKDALVESTKETISEISQFTEKKFRTLFGEKDFKHKKSKGLTYNNIPKLAKGGDVKKSGLAIIHKSETISPSKILQAQLDALKKIVFTTEQLVKQNFKSKGDLKDFTSKVVKNDVKIARRLETGSMTSFDRNIDSVYKTAVMANMTARKSFEEIGFIRKLWRAYVSRPYESYVETEAGQMISLLRQIVDNLGGTKPLTLWERIEKGTAKILAKHPAIEFLRYSIGNIYKLTSTLLVKWPTQLIAGIGQSVGKSVLNIFGFRFKPFFKGDYANDIKSRRSGQPLDIIAESSVNQYRWTRIYGEQMTSQLNTLIKLYSGSEVEREVDPLISSYKNWKKRRSGEPKDTGPFLGQSIRLMRYDTADLVLIGEDIYEEIKAITNTIKKDKIEVSLEKNGFDKESNIISFPSVIKEFKELPKTVGEEYSRLYLETKKQTGILQSIDNQSKKSGYIFKKEIDESDTKREQSNKLSEITIRKFIDREERQRLRDKSLAERMEQEKLSAAKFQAEKEKGKEKNKGLLSSIFGGGGGYMDWAKLLFAGSMFIPGGTSLLGSAISLAVSHPFIGIPLLLSSPVLLKGLIIGGAKGIEWLIKTGWKKIGGFKGLWSMTKGAFNIGKILIHGIKTSVPVLISSLANPLIWGPVAIAIASAIGYQIGKIPVVKEFMEKMWGKVLPKGGPITSDEWSAQRLDNASQYSRNYVLERDRSIKRISTLGQIDNLSKLQERSKYISKLKEETELDYNTAYNQLKKSKGKTKENIQSKISLMETLLPQLREEEKYTSQRIIDIAPIIKAKEKEKKERVSSIKMFNEKLKIEESKKKIENIDKISSAVTYTNAILSAGKTALKLPTAPIINELVGKGSVSGVKKVLDTPSSTPGVTALRVIGAYFGGLLKDLNSVIVTATDKSTDFKFGESYLIKSYQEANKEYNNKIKEKTEWLKLRDKYGSIIDKLFLENVDINIAKKYLSAHKSQYITQDIIEDLTNKKPLLKSIKHTSNEIYISAVELLAEGISRIDPKEIVKSINTDKVKQLMVDFGTSTTAIVAGVIQQMNSNLGTKLETGAAAVGSAITKVTSINNNSSSNTVNNNNAGDGFSIVPKKHIEAIDDIYAGKYF